MALDEWSIRPIDVCHKETRNVEMLLRKSFRYFVLVLFCLMLLSCTGKDDFDRESEKTTSVLQEKPISVSEDKFNEINEFMREFMVFPVICDFDQQDMSGAVDFFAQKWVWMDITAMEYDAESKAFYISASEFVEKMGQYFVMSDSALKSIDRKALQGRIKICADMDLPWGFDYIIDQAKERDGAYFIHGRNAEVTETSSLNNDELFIGSNEKPFLEFNAVIVRDERDGKFRLKELSGLKNGPGRKINVSEISDAEMKELTEFAQVYLQGPILEGFDLNDLTVVFDFSTQKILQTKPEVVGETDEGRCIVPLSELISFMEQCFYLPKGFEKCLPREGEGKDGYPCLANDGVAFIRHEGAAGVDLRADTPVIQNEVHYRFGVYNVAAEALKKELAAEGNSVTDIDTAVKEQFPFELAVIRAVRCTDGKLRLVYIMPYYL